MILRLAYTLFLAVLFAAFVGFGIAAFYEAPKVPEYPSELKLARPEGTAGEVVYEDLKIKQEQYDREFKEFEEKSKTYNRNVALIAIAASIVTLSISLTLFKRIMVIADGLLLGGVLTLIYSIIRGIASGSDKFRFLMVTLGFLIALILGYVKLIKTSKGK